MATTLPEFSHFDCDEVSNIGTRWKKWIARFEILITAIGIKGAEKARRLVLLLHYIGSDCYDIYDTLKEAGKEYDAVKMKLDGYFILKANTEYEKYIFGNSKQKDGGENIDQFCTRLNKLSINWIFKSR